jgi:hypothetical protein
MISIQLEWAIQTKTPESSGDYQVLAASAGGLDIKGWHALIRKWLTGDVPSGAPGADPPAPWFQFGVEQEPLRLAVLRQAWSGYSDGSHRSVLETTCLLLPFADLQKSGCGFRQMQELFDKPGVDAFLKERIAAIKAGQGRLEDALLEVPLPGRDETLARMRQAVEQAGFNACARAAEALLKGPLALLQPGGNTPIPELADRLAWLDGVLALLPYGLRSDCPACSWASGGIDHQMRLYWARRPRPGQKCLVPAHLPGEAGLVEPPGRYFENLCALQDRLEEGLEYLLDQGRPVPFDHTQPDAILQGFKQKTAPVSEPETVPIEKPANPAVPPGSSPAPQPASIVDIVQSAINEFGSILERVFDAVIPQQKKQLPAPLPNTQELSRTQQPGSDNEKVTIPAVGAHELIPDILTSVDSGHGKQAFEKLLDAWKKMDSAKKPHQKAKMLNSLQVALERPGYGRFAKLERWAAENLPDEFWYGWVNQLLNDFPERSLEPFLRCLEQAGEVRPLVCFLKIAAGKMQKDIDKEFLNDFQTKPFYSIWLIQLAAKTRMLDKVFEPVGSWLLERKKARLPYNRDLLMEKTRNLPVAQLSPRAQLLLTELRKN